MKSDKDIKKIKKDDVFETQCNYWLLNR